MSVILNQEYGYAMLEHLDIFDLCVLFRVDVATRAFLVLLGGTKTFGEYIIGLATTTKDKLKACVELDLLDEFKQIIERLDIEETYRDRSGSSLGSREERWELIGDLTAICHTAAEQGKTEFMRPIMHELHTLYDENHDEAMNDYSDCLCRFISTAVKHDRPSVARYMLSGDRYPGDFLAQGLETAWNINNRDAMVFFLDRPQIPMSRGELYVMLQINDNDLYDKYIERVVHDRWNLYWNHWDYVVVILDIPLSNNNEYLYEKVCELALSLTGSGDVRRKIPLHRDEYMKPQPRIGQIGYHYNR